MKFLDILKTVWAWLRKNWQWIVFPVGVLLFFASYLSVPKKYISDKELDEPIRKALDELKQSDDKRRAQLEQLEQEHKERLRVASEEQIEQIKQLKEKPIEEIVAWFNAL